MTSSQPTQPLTDEELARTMLARRRGAVQSLNGCDCMQPDSHGIVLDSLGDIPRLLAEVSRLRAELDEAHRTAGAEHGRAAALGAAYREACTARDARDTEIERLRAENTAQAEQLAELTTTLQRPNIEPDEEFDAVREAALKWKGGRGVKTLKDLIDAFDWLRSELAYAERIKSYIRKQHTDLEGAFDLVIAQCGKLRAERDGVGELLDKVVDLHPAGFCETCNVEGPCPTRRALGLDQDGSGQA